MRLSLMAALCAAASVTAATGVAHAATDYPALFDATWKAVDQGFYDPNFRGVDWSAVGQRYRARLGAIRDDTGFRKLVTEMLGELHSSHLYLNPPGSSSAAKVSVGAEIADMDDQAVVSDVALLSDAWRKGMRPGQVLLSPQDALGGPLGSQAAISVEACDGRRLELKVRRERTFWPPAGPAIYWTRINRGPGQVIGYVRLDRFDDGADLMIDRAMADLAKTDGLIIDVRMNSGGNVSALRLASYFTGPRAPAIALFAQPYLKALGHPVTAADVAAAPPTAGVYTDGGVFKAVSAGQGRTVFYTEDMGEKAYRAPVVVLIGSDTGSAGEGFAWAMKLKTKARLIGRPTAGALLSSAKVDVGQGWTLTLPVQGLWGPDGRDYGDKAVPPDEVLPRPAADLCSGRDGDLERAMDLLAPSHAAAGR